MLWRKSGKWSSRDSPWILLFIMTVSLLKTRRRTRFDRKCKLHAVCTNHCHMTWCSGFIAWLNYLRVNREVDSVIINYKLNEVPCLICWSTTGFIPTHVLSICLHERWIKIQGSILSYVNIKTFLEVSIRKKKKRKVCTKEQDIVFLLSPLWKKDKLHFQFSLNRPIRPVSEYFRGRWQICIKSYLPTRSGASHASRLVLPTELAEVPSAVHVLVLQFVTCP